MAERPRAAYPCATRISPISPRLDRLDFADSVERVACSGSHSRADGGHRLFAEKCVEGIVANRETCERYAELTLSAATALNPYIGYDRATEIVKEAAASGRPLREVAPGGRRRGVRSGRGARLPEDGQATRRLARLTPLGNAPRRRRSVGALEQYGAGPGRRCT